MTLKVKTIPCESIRIEHPESSYGIFCFNEAGDLFLASDWGFYGYSWRAFGTETFKDWLSDLGEDYIINKFENTVYNNGIKKGIPSPIKKHLTNLILEFKKELFRQAQMKDEFLEAGRDSPEAYHLNNG